MAATFNPQAAADQARNAYRNVTAQLGLLALDTAIPEALGAVAEKTVDQTREAYDRSKDALEASIATFERSFDAAGWGAAAFNHKIIDIAQRNLNSGFDLANSLAGAKNLAEIVELQAAYWRKQFSALTAQAEEVPALSTKVVADAGEPLKGHLMNSMDEAAQGELNVLRRDGNTPRASADLGPAQFRSTAMSIPHYVNEHQSDIRTIKPGWYGMESNGKPSSGPFPKQEKCITGITQPRSNFPASPWRHATHNPEVAAAKKAAMDYLAHAQAAMDAQD
jgi:phasin